MGCGRREPNLQAFVREPLVQLILALAALFGNNRLLWSARGHWRRAPGVRSAFRLGPRLLIAVPDEG